MISLLPFRTTNVPDYGSLHYRNSIISHNDNVKGYPTIGNCNNIVSYRKDFMLNNIMFQHKIPQIVKEASLSDKVNAILNKVSEKDILVVCNNIRSCKRAILNSLTEYAMHPMKTIYYITDSKIKECIGFFKTNTGFNVWNLSEKKVDCDGQLLGIDEVVHSDNNISVKLENNTISVSKENIQNAKDLLYFSKYFMREFDFSGIYHCSAILNNSLIKDALLNQTQNKNETDTEDVNDGLLLKSKRQQNYNNLPLTEVISSRIGGQNQIINNLFRDIIAPIKQPEAFKNMTNKNAIFYGPPGTGKTLMAEIIADVSGASCYKIKASELSSKWVGGTEDNIKQLHKEALENQPSIIIIDEIDAIAQKRDGSDKHGEKALNLIFSIISEDTSQKNQIYWLGTTNRLELLDNALLRSGRFEKKYEFLPPQTTDEIEQIFNIHSSQLPLDSKIDKSLIFKRLLNINATGADIKAIVDNAFQNSYTRNNIYQSINNGTYSKKMLKSCNISTEDFINAIDEFKTGNVTRRKIGF